MLVRHAQLVERSNNFLQNHTALSAGAKWLLNKTLQIETIYSNFVQATGSRFGQSLNLGSEEFFKKSYSSLSCTSLSLETE